jgi:HTH-type transcriptional regulator / antitoxin HigA
MNYAKALLSPPGDTLQEHLTNIGMSQSALALRMGRPKEKINDIIKGREPISTATAYQLERVLGISAGFWINRERAYRQELYELQQQEAADSHLAWLRAFPITEMQQLGWIPASAAHHVLIDELLKFFGIASPDSWRHLYLNDEPTPVFNISLAHTQNPFANAAWLRKGELQAQEMKLRVYDKKGFRQILTQVREIAKRSQPNFPSTQPIVC